MQHSNPLIENYIRELLLIYFARQRMILSIAAIIFLASVAVAFFATPRYAAQGTLLLRSADTQRTPDILDETELRIFKVTEEDLRSEIELIRSPGVIQGAIEKLVSHNFPNADLLDWLKIQSKLETEVVPDSRIINVELQRDNAEEATAILNAIMDVYIFRRSEISYPEGSKDFFVTQLERFDQLLDQTELSLIDLAKETRAPEPTKEIEHNLLTKQHLAERLDLLLTEEAGLIQQINHLDQELASEKIGHFSYLPNNTISEISARLVDLKMERGKTARHYADDAKVVAVIDKQIGDTLLQIREEVKNFRNKLQSDLYSNAEQQKVLRDRINDIENRNLDLYKQSLTTAKLNREAEVIGKSFSTFFKRREEAEIQSSSESPPSQFHVSVVNQAYSTGIPVFPNRPVLMITGLLAGLITGFSLGFIREFFDHSFKNPRDVEQYSGLPLLFSVPLINKRCTPKRESMDNSIIDAA